MPPHTVFIVGAGASVPFGLPTGDQLRNRLCDSSNIFAYYKKLESLYGPRAGRVLEQMNNLSSLLARSGSPTIDAFLESNPELEELGKQLIAAALLPDEINAIEHPKPGWDWLGWLFNNVKPINKWLDPSWPIGFITFNYDRIIEFAFREMLAIRLGLENKKAGEIVERSPIVHMYGRFVDFSEDDINSPLRLSIRTLWSNISVGHYYKAATGIDLISTNRDGSAAMPSRVETAQRMLQQAKVIIFLGYGFDETNNARLGIARDGKWPIVSAQEIYSTGYGMYGIERNIPISILTPVGRSPLSRSLFEQRLGQPNMECLDYLRQHITRAHLSPD